MKPFAHFSNEISMVFQSPGCCCEALIDGLDSPGGCCEAIYKLFEGSIYGFGISGSCREAMIDGLDSPGGRCEAICILFK